MSTKYFISYQGDCDSWLSHVLISLWGSKKVACATDRPFTSTSSTCSLENVFLLYWWMNEAQGHKSAPVLLSYKSAEASAQRSLAITQINTPRTQDYTQACLISIKKCAFERHFIKIKLTAWVTRLFSLGKPSSIKSSTMFIYCKTER